MTLLCSARTAIKRNKSSLRYRRLHDAGGSTIRLAILLRNSVGALVANQD